MGLEEKEISVNTERTTKKVKKQVSSRGNSTKSNELSNEYRDRILSVFQKQKKYALELRKTTASQRIIKLKKLKDIIEIHADDIRRAIKEDFRNSENFHIWYQEHPESTSLN